MKNRMKNETHIEGYVYTHNLEEKVSGQNAKTPGVEFISGNLSIATDEDLLNVVQVHFTYVTAVTKAGKPNLTYSILKSIIDNKMGNVMDHGKENAAKVRIDSALALNEWFDYKQDPPALVSLKRNEGGFVHQTQMLNDDEKERATFNTDILITNVRRIEADEERGTPEKGIVKGYIFNFRNDLLPIEFSLFNPKAIDYFESLDASPNTPVFTRVQGQQISKTVTRTITEENAFGEAIVKSVPSSQKDLVITWALPGGYEWDSEDSILASELTKLMADREVYLADLKKKSDEYLSSKDNALAGISKSNTSISKSDYDF